MSFFFQKSAAMTQVSVAVLEGALLKSRSFFPYYMLLALEAGGPLRALVLLFLHPVIWLASKFAFSRFIAIRIMIFISVAGLKLSDVCAVSRGVLPKFLMDDLHVTDACCRFVNGKRKIVLTSHPTVMVQHFLSFHVGADAVLGTELHCTEGGLCTGLVGHAGVLTSEKMPCALVGMLGDCMPDVGLGCMPVHKALLSLCKEGCILPQAGRKVVQHGSYKDLSLKPVVFHDGRLVVRPTPTTCLAMCLWIPVSFILMLLRLSVVLTLPKLIGNPILAGLGLRLRVKGAPPLLQGDMDAGYVLYACTHRTLVDPLFVIAGLRRTLRALTYSISRFTELLSPIKTSRLSRNRERDAQMIRELLKHEDLIICPEGTTCREPFLLRFSPLFADVADVVVPIAVDVHMGLFHATSARGYKSLDPIFLLMNPRPTYEITFLEPWVLKELRADGKSGIVIANSMQEALANALGFECTRLTRRDKYTLLAGNDGTVKQ